MLRAFGVDVSTPDDARDALREREVARWSRPLEPVLVAWDGVLDEVRVRAPAAKVDAIGGVTIELDGGHGSIRVATSKARRRWPVEARHAVGGREFVRIVLHLGVRDLPWGYHRIGVHGLRTASRALVVSAPRRAPSRRHRGWGLFAPLYALRTATDLGVGDLGGLDALIDWTTSLGGDVVATLPLLAAFLGEEGTFEPGPYAPASRLFWNDLYVDLTRLPGRSEPSTSGGALVDYRAAMASRRAAFERSLAALPGPSLDEFEDWIRRHPGPRDYARFRAAGERHGAAWMQWPAGEREGRLPPDPARERIHLFGQWQITRQLRETADRATAAGARLYFDLPLGVNVAGYDVWRHRDAFALDAKAGAPPDSFFPKGQDWAFPPLHPERTREDSYAYPIACFRTVLRYARILRIDHVMSLNRLFWVPRGTGPETGVYVRGHPEELYAILSLEAHRHDALIVGEDLGTVPPGVRGSMRRHGVHRMYVVEVEARPRGADALPEPPADAAAGLDTHDLPTFASFWRGLDVEQRRRRGWLGDAEARRATRDRARLRRAVIAFLRGEGLLTRRGEPSDREVLRSCLAFLARSDAAMVTVNLEDLWLETRPQNVPGTTQEQEPNWRRRLARTFDEFRGDDDVVGTLAMVDRLRKGKHP